MFGDILTEKAFVDKCLRGELREIYDMFPTNRHALVRTVYRRRPDTPYRVVRVPGTTRSSSGRVSCFGGICSQCVFVRSVRSAMVSQALRRLLERGPVVEGKCVRE